MFLHALHEQVLLGFNVHRAVLCASEHKSFLVREVFMDPEQNFHPKLSTFIDEKNNIVSPPLEDLSPFLKRKELKKNLLVDLHAKSKLIKK